MRGDSLHSVEDDRVPSHTKVIVRAPDIDLVLWIGRVCDWKFGRQSIDVVEVPVRPELSASIQFSLYIE